MSPAAAWRSPPPADAVTDRAHRAQHRIRNGDDPCAGARTAGGERREASLCRVERKGDDFEADAGGERFFDQVRTIEQRVLAGPVAAREIAKSANQGVLPAGNVLHRRILRDNRNLPVP